MNRARRLLLSGAALAGLLLPATVAAEGSASAATTPVVYAAHADGWHAYRKPGSFYFGNGGAPYFTNLTWKSWGTNSAWATGKIWIHKSCTPSYKCGYTSRWVGVYLSVPKYHGPARYYGKMSVKLPVSGKLKWEAGYFTAPKGLISYWKFPLVWPYL
jgi:hypothetical protein